ncbi:uncharacterized protein [Tenebrio molitor]|uniref:uncharacterized protein isoform X2 n=1 Tax=Tenebrio molitor TaxID=7067 RepID=UPI00362499A5
MISANFAVAVVTVVLRGLLDRILAAVQAPAIRTPLLPSSTGRRIRVAYSPSNSRRSKVLDGHIRKSGSQSSSASNLRDHRTWLPRKFRSHRSRSRCRNNLLQATKDSLQMLHHDCSSTCSLSSKTVSSTKCDCTKEDSLGGTVTKEGSPSVYSIKSDGENVLEKIEDKPLEPDVERFQGFGDCDWEEHRPKTVKRRRKTKTTRKTRSGKIYSSYL